MVEERREIWTMTQGDPYLKLFIQSLSGEPHWITVSRFAKNRHKSNTEKTKVEEHLDVKEKHPHGQN